MKKAILFDIECDGLNPTKIHCLAAKNEVGYFSLTDYGMMRKLFAETDIVIGHDITRFDIPVLERLLNIKVKCKVIDTLALSWYLEPDRMRHGLEWYGEDFGIPKPKIDDWFNLTTEEYVHRCVEDVKINNRLWEMQWAQLLKMYGSEDKAMELIDYLSFKMACAAEQEKNGWKLDIDRCKKLRDKLVEEKEAKTVELSNAMPKKAIIARKSRPAKPYKKDGSLSEAGKNWFSLLSEMHLPENHMDDIEYIKGYEEPNPGSHNQIKDWLYSLGWKPQTFQYKRDKVTGDVKKIPQVQQDKTLGPGLCKSVIALYGKEPKLEVLDGLSIVTHRLSIVEGFLANVDDRGYLKAEIQGFTNTLRFKHRIIVNLPGVQTLYGEDIRGCLIADDGKELCGSDASGLEDRLKQHYIWPYDPDYVLEMNGDDYDPHLDLALQAGAITKQEFDEYKLAEHKDKRVKAIRHTYKQGNYACQYGAGGPRVALTCGISTYEGNKLVEIYWKRNWAIRKAADDLTVRVFNGSKWLYNPVSKFWYSLRNDKDKFSTLVQGTGVYAFDVWLSYVRKNGPPIIGQFHDEWVALINKGKREKCTEHVREAMRKTNEELKLNRELDCDIQYGDNYSDIH